MTIVKRASIATSALALFTIVSVAPSFAQAPPPSQPPAPAPQPRMEQPAAPATTSVSGDLVSVDTKMKTLTVKTLAGKEEQLRYNDATKVVGADSGIEGLARSSGTKVTVRFSGTGPDRLATEITITPAKQ